MFLQVKKFYIFFLLFFLALFSVFTEEALPTSEEDSEQKDQKSFSIKNTSYNAIVFLKDVLDDKYPLRIDFGAEPHRHGSLVFGSIWYDWNNILSSSIRGEYDHYMTFLNSGKTVSTTEVRSVSFTPFPVVLFFGNPDIKAKSVFTEVDIGFYLSESHSNTNDGSYLNYTESGFQLSETNTRYVMLGPAFNIVVKVPIIKYIDSITEFFFVPAYFLSYNSNSQIDDNLHSSKSSVTGFDLSSPYLKYSLCLDFFRYIRIKSQVTYQHINMRQTIYGEENDVRYSNHKLTVRYGGELLNPSKTRKKSAHLWAGLYYEMTWEKLYLGSASSNDYTGKWVLCFGT